MSFSLSQRFSPDTPLIHRFFVGSYITDEIFGITIAQKGYVNPWYSYGAILVAVPLWGIGTAAGIVAGSLLPASVVAALGVMLYGMFLCIFIPPARKDRSILLLIVICFGASFAASVLPYIRKLSSGNRTLVLTVLISAAAALIAPRKEEEAHD
jgi:predicted branched-subunit amino acid permease